METSHSERLANGHESAGRTLAEIDVSPDASPRTVAAIVGALDAYRATERAAQEGSSTTSPDEEVDRWRMAGRWEHIHGSVVRDRSQLPRNPWRVRSRSDH